MQNRFGRTGSVVVLGALATLASGAILAKQPPRVLAPEDRLLGIQLMASSYRDVLHKFGQPHEIQEGGPFLPTTGYPAPPGGAPGIPSYSGAEGGPSLPGSAGGGGGSRATSKNGFPGRGGGGAGGPGGSPYGGAPGSGGMPGMPGGGSPYGGSPYGGAPTTGGMPGMTGSGSPYGGSPYGGAPGTPGMPGMPRMGGGAGGPSLPGFNSQPGAEGEGGGYPGMPGAGPGENTGEPSGPNREATWWYHYPKTGTHISFLFNKQGRVIQIQEYGWKDTIPGGKTRQGVGLGAGLDTVLKHYGWSNEGVHDGENIVMRYGKPNQVVFQVVKNQVLGITIGVNK